MKTRRDKSTLKTKLEEVYEESYRKSKHAQDVAAFTILLTVVLGGLFGWFVFGPWLSSL